MQRILDRFVRYARVDTASDESSSSAPSTPGQLDLLRMLEAELAELGLADARISEGGVLYASMPGPADKPVIGLVAHVDTSPEEPGAGVVPVLHERWDGSPIHLGGGVVVDPSRSKQMDRYRGTTIVTSDGTTLLGADDKAGVAVIMGALERLASSPDLPRPGIRVAFTPDEEIGRGVDNFDVEGFGADFAYTVDGSLLDNIETATFNAWSAEWTFRGRQVHPGSAGGLMVNAVRIAAETVAALRPEEMPENSSGVEGYDYPMAVSGTAGEARLRMILRDFTAAGMLSRRTRMQALRDYMAAKHPGAVIELVMKEQYRNPAETLEADRRPVEYALEGARLAGVQPVEGRIRGGTDGSRLSFMGLPCVNLPTGVELFHSREEWISEQGMELACSILIETLGVWARRS
jgi:tripeptide aminopeptidase